MEMNVDQQIGFVVSALFGGAIEAADVRRWADEFLLANEKYPYCVVEMSTFDGIPGKIHGIVGNKDQRWPEHLGSYEDCHAAFYGIAWRRGEASYDADITREEAEEILMKNPLILQIFRAMFPWVEIPEPGRG